MKIIVLYKNVQRYLENVINYTDVLILILLFILALALQNLVLFLEIYFYNNYPILITSSLSDIFKSNKHITVV